MKELCIDARMSLNSGIGTYIRNIVGQLKKSSLKLRLIVSQDIVDKWPESKSFDLILTSAPIYSIEEQIKLPFLIPKCDFFWSPHYNVPLLPIRAKIRILTLHDVYHLAFAKTLSFHKRFYAKAMINSAVRLSDCIITDSVFSESEIVKYTGVQREKIQIIYHGIDHLHFKNEFSASFLSAVQAKYNLPEKFFLFVSTLASHKNVARLLKAWNLLKNIHSNWKLIFVGKHTKDTQWKQVIKENPTLIEKVRFLGQVDDADLPGIYHLAFATILPSLYEGFGLPPLESMSCGTPVIVSNVASFPEICGACAIYIDPYDESNIAKGIQQMIQDPLLHSQLAQIGIKRSQQFDWQQSAERHIQIFERQKSTTPP